MTHTNRLSPIRRLDSHLIPRFNLYGIDLTAPTKVSTFTTSLSNTKFGAGPLSHQSLRGFENRPWPIHSLHLEQFTQGRPLHVILASSPCFSGAEIVQPALSRVGEDRYHVLTNNCEHFCEWCVRAEPRSYQVDRWLLWPLRTRATYVAAKLVNPFGRLKPLHA